MAEHPSSAQVVVFGGTADVGGNLKDTWSWDSSQWNENKPSTSPFARNRHSMATNSYRSEVVLYGGEGEMLYEDTWVWGWAANENTQEDGDTNDGRRTPGF